MNEVLLLGSVSGEAVYYCDQWARDLLRFRLRTEPSSAARMHGRRAGFQHHHCIAWGPAALDLAQHLRPGSVVQLRGELIARKLRTEDGRLTRQCEVHVRSYTYLGDRPARPA